MYLKGDRMNYLWECMLQIMQQEIPEEKIQFQIAKEYSPYMELSLPYLNQGNIKDRIVIEVNPYYRFYDIFKNLYEPNLTDFKQLRKSLTNLIFHSLSQSDSLSGMTRMEYLKKLLYQDIKISVYGDFYKSSISYFTRNERELILSGIIRQQQIGSSLDIFKNIATALISNIIIYHNNDNAHEILIFIGQKKNNELEVKMTFLIRMFLEIQYKLELYYEYHFGIIGVEETMVIDEMSLC